MVTVPRLVVAAPASGHGKTTVATGLMAALTASGLSVSPHKIGPDYIDPGYHALAAGRPGRNLDAVLCGEELVVPLFLHGASGCDIAIVEGVMGLYDGRGTTSYGSTAHVASLLDAPVLFVVDAAAQGRSVAAAVAGFQAYDQRIRIAGVVLNRVGSDRHEEILRTALSELGIAVLGVLRRDDAISAPSRHLGLVPAAERAATAVSTVDNLGAAMAASVDLAAVVGIARSAGSLAGRPWQAPVRQVSRRPIVAIAAGPAFTFSYAETAELLTAAGAQAVPFDPLHDPQLPHGTAGLVIGGGFPEIHAETLSGNEPLRRAVAAFDGPIAAECAGLLYLSRELDGHPMCGVLDAKAAMTPRLSLGYRDAVSATDSVLLPRGVSVTGHEFHRTAVEPAAGPAAWSYDGRSEGFAIGSVHASYLHLHWAGHPEIASRFVQAAAG
ncbi:cobyrinate a,c-diamide synthase [Fodinicola acaciae]|uniref:cobyrinate a,c-diamide synthase n=1 Tax=Fodinicola acaciae TaxID=2681555 RepID=UPI0013D2FC5A|nr:cobyrinate a,c-diamide synthase [Fodinicola acaciae]